MTDTVEQTATEASPVTSPKKGKASTKRKATGTKSAKKKVSHPPTSQMVTAAIKDLKERGGSSLQAIKKYINTNYQVDVEKMSLFIRKYIKSAVESGELVQTKGKGAAGSFKLGGGEVGTQKKKATTTATKTRAKRPAAEKKKPAAKKAKEAPKKKETAASKDKKTKKPPTTAKAPKPKKTTKAPAKKAASAKSKAKKPAGKKASPKKK